MENKTGFSLQQILSCGELLKDQGSKQIKLLNDVDTTVKHLRTVNDACAVKQSNAEKTALTRAAATENLLSILIDQSRTIQHVTGVSHSILRHHAADADHQAAQMMGLLQSVKSTIDHLKEEKRSSKELSSLAPSHRSGKPRHQIAEV